MCVCGWGSKRVGMKTGPKHESIWKATMSKTWKFQTRALDVLNYEEAFNYWNAFVSKLWSETWMSHEKKMPQIPNLISSQIETLVQNMKCHETWTCHEHEFANTSTQHALLRGPSMLHAPMPQTQTTACAVSTKSGSKPLQAQLKLVDNSKHRRRHRQRKQWNEWGALPPKPPLLRRACAAWAQGAPRATRRQTH